MYIGVIFGEIATVVSGPLGPDSEYVYGVMQLRMNACCAVDIVCFL